MQYSPEESNLHETITLSTPYKSEGIRECGVPHREGLVVVERSFGVHSLYDVPLMTDFWRPDSFAQKVISNGFRYGLLYHSSQYQGLRGTGQGTGYGDGTGTYSTRFANSAFKRRMQSSVVGSFPWSVHGSPHTEQIVLTGTASGFAGVFLRAAMLFCGKAVSSPFVGHGRPHMVARLVEHFARLRCAHIERLPDLRNTVALPVHLKGFMFRVVEAIHRLDVSPSHFTLL